jgi:hypothetical protein
VFECGCFVINLVTLNPLQKCSSLLKLATE